MVKPRNCALLGSSFVQQEDIGPTWIKDLQRDLEPVYVPDRLEKQQEPKRERCSLFL